MQTQAASVIDLSAKPDGIWNYTTIDIPAGTKVSFKSNPNNTPVIWLATGSVRIAGEINLDGAFSSSVDPSTEAPGGPGGGAGGLGGRRFDVSASFAGTPGEGPGGGLPGTTQSQAGGGVAMGLQGRDRLEDQPTAPAWSDHCSAALVGEVARRRIRAMVATVVAEGEPSSSRRLTRSRLVAVFTPTGELSGRTAAPPQHVVAAAPAALSAW